MVFLYSIIALIVLAIISAVLIFYAAAEDKVGTFVVGFVGAIATIVLSITYFCNIWSWYSAESKASIINKEYGTNYTATEVFLASDVIEEIQQAKRKRVEVNGDLFKTTENK